MITVFTSATISYLPNSRLLARSAKAFHPDWQFVLLLNDMSPEWINWADEPFDEIVFAHHLPIPNFRQWAFGYNVVELCTATKGAMATYLFEERESDAILYLDPDTMVFSRFQEVIDQLAVSDVILTPHLTDPEEEPNGIESHEIAALKHGTFNLGFFAVRNTRAGRSFLDWWTRRLLNYAYIDFGRGLFTDQKWCNLVPYMFKGIAVLTNRTYNVATWNIKNRRLEKNPRGGWTVNGQPLRFYHFSGFGNGFAWADYELERFAQNSPGLIELWQQYKELYQASSLGNSAPPWYWGHFANGAAVTQADRTRYTNDQALREAFPDPYSDACFIRLRDGEIGPA